MNKCDLKTGMIVELENGIRYLVIRNFFYGEPAKSFLVRQEGYINLGDYREDMTCFAPNGTDISKVMIVSNPKEVFQLKSNTLRVIWDKKMGEISNSVYKKYRVEIFEKDHATLRPTLNILSDILSSNVCSECDECGEDNLW